MNSFRAIIGLWSSIDAMAVEIGAPVTAVRKWSQRDRIPAEWWQAIAQAPVAHRSGVTAELMAELIARRASSVPATVRMDPL
jgi:hypothetical protein